MSEPADLLHAGDASGYLLQRGLIGAGEPVVVCELSGGVSNVVLAVTGGSRSFICKQSLPRLRVADEWLADRGRVVAEAEALGLCRALTPECVPAVLDSDPCACTVSIEHAPAGWGDWKRRLLSGVVDPGVAGRLGVVLARWQNATAGGAGLSERLRRYGAFEQLRVDPYHRTVAARMPDYADAVDSVVGEMAGRRICLTHGDFSPKNVLVAPDGTGLWVIDFEVAHLGDPAFDVAFLLSHLLLKSIHRPADAQALGGCVDRFTEAWSGAVHAGIHPGWAAISRQLGCLLLARVVGKSPVEYLDPAGQDAAVALGCGLLDAPAQSPAAIWARCTGSPQ